MKRYVPILLVIVVAAVIVWQGSAMLSDPSAEPDIRRDETPPGEPPPLLGADGEGTKPADEGPVLKGDSGAREGVHPADGSAPAPGEEETPAVQEVEVVALYAGEMPEGWHDAPPAQRAHAIRPPRPRGPSFSPGGRSGGFGPTGHRSRFPPPPPLKGTAALEVVVRDESGKRVPGADVYLGPRESLHKEAVSFGDLRRIGRTDEQGNLTVPDLPAGAAVLAGNLENFLNGPRGLDMRTSIPVLLVARATVRARLTLPLDLGAFGTVTGRVVDEQDRPVVRAEVRCGFFRTYADGEGRFEAPRLTAGLQTLTVMRAGYTSESVEVDVPAGGTRDVEVVLAYRESGSLHLEGRVLDADGNAVETASVYFMAEGGGTLRSAKSDAEGHYRLEDLPDRLLEAPCRIQADKFREGYPATVVRLENGIRNSHLDLQLPPRRVRVRFQLRDAGNGEAVTRCRIEPERLDDTETTVRGFLGSNADGVFEHWFDAGRYRFQVEAPDHQTRTLEVDLVHPGETVDLEVDLTPKGTGSVQVTLRVKVEDAATGAPVTACTIVIVDAEEEAEVARLEGNSGDGTYSMPVSSGRRILRVSAPEYEAAEEIVDLPAQNLEADVTIHLRPQ